MVDSWSFSALEQYELCPAQYAYQRIAKIPTKPKRYFEKGLRVHKQLEAFVISRGTIWLTDEVKKEVDFVKEVANLNAPIEVEQKWGFAKDWARTSWDRAWFRVVIDVLFSHADWTADIVDWKTGGKRDESKDQMELSALSVLWRRNVSDVTTHLVYVEKGGHLVADYSYAQRAELTAKWEARAAKLFEETEWRPRPSDKCALCDYAKSKGGPCRYG